MKNKIIGIIGSRRRNEESDMADVEKVFLKIYKPGDKICSGGCPMGGDRFAEILAQKYNVEIIIFKPDWKKYGRSAGFIRNADIAKKSDILIACVAKDRKGGTEDTIKKYKKFKKEEIYVVE